MATETETPIAWPTDWVTFTEWEGLRTYWRKSNSEHQWCSLTNFETEADITAGVVTLRLSSSLTQTELSTLAREDAKCHRMKAVRFLPDRPARFTKRLLNSRELATILHGLRLIQCEGRIEGCAAGDCEHFDVQGRGGPLTNDEIDTLCEAINCGQVRL